MTIFEQPTSYVQQAVLQEKILRMTRPTAKHLNFDGPIHL